MRHPRLNRAVSVVTTALLATLMAALSGGGTTAAAEPSLPDLAAAAACSSDRILDVPATKPLLLPPVCDWTGKTLKGKSVTLVIPARARGAGAHQLGVNGEDSEELSVVVAADGSVTANRDEPISGGPRPATDQGCNQLTYSDSGNAEKQTLNWGFHKLSTPSYMSPANAEFAIASGANWLASGNNDCGLPANLSASHVYNGNSERATSPGANGGCGAEDGYNRVNFAELNTGALAVTCTYWDSIPGVNDIDEADIRFDRDASWATSIVAGCSGRYDLASVATHEWGHAFGLGHSTSVDSSATSQTMSATIPACDTTKRTLGRGDYKGIFDKY